MVQAVEGSDVTRRAAGVGPLLTIKAATASVGRDPYRPKLGYPGAMRILLALLAIPACAAQPGAGAVTPPAAGPVLRLLGCTPAQPLPRAAVGIPSWSDIANTIAEIAESEPPEIGPPYGIAWVTPDTPMVSGTPDAGVAIRAIQPHLGQLRTCYQRAQRDAPSAEGTATAELVVDGNGRVVASPVTGRDFQPSFLACVSRVLQACRFPRGSPLRVRYPLQFTIDRAHLGPEPPSPTEARAQAPWRPFKLDHDLAWAWETNLAAATDAAVRAGLPALDGCFRGVNVRGSLRAMLAVRADGSIESARVGGLGEPEVEVCLADRLRDLRVARRIEPDVRQTACDLTLGEARPWRVSPGAGYVVLEATRRGVRHGADLRAPGALDSSLLPAHQTYLVVVDADTPGAVIARALAWAAQGDATLIALRDGARSPLLVGVGPTEHQRGGMESAIWPVLELGSRELLGCAGHEHRVAVADADAVDAMLRAMFATCRAESCGSTLGIAMEPDATAARLYAVADAARRAGFDRVLLGSNPGCVDDPGPR